MNASERINAIAKHFNSNIKAIAELCGYERPQAFYDVVSGKTKNISPSMCDKIISRFPQINRIWLLTGSGDMLEDANPKVTDMKKAMNMVPIVRLSALAGPISSYYEAGDDLKDSEYIYSPIPEAEMAIRISGDSMEPTFQNGGIAFISKINEASFIPWGHALVLDTENGVFIKNVLPDNDNSDYIWAKSINPKYPPMHVPKRSIFRMFRVLCVTTMFPTM